MALSIHKLKEYAMTGTGWSHNKTQNGTKGAQPLPSQLADRTVGYGLIVGGFLLPAFALASYLTYHEPPRDYTREAVAKQVNETVAAQIPWVVKSIDDNGDLVKQFAISGEIDRDRLFADINAANRQTIAQRQERRQVGGMAALAGVGMSFAGAFLLFRRRTGDAPTNG
jgi:hypothetical protein